MLSSTEQAESLNVSDGENANLFIELTSSESMIKRMLIMLIKKYFWYSKMNYLYVYCLIYFYLTPLQDGMEQMRV